MIISSIIKPIARSIVQSIICAVSSVIPGISQWILTLDGTNWMELSEPVEFTGDYEVEVEVSGVPTDAAHRYMFDGPASGDFRFTLLKTNSGLVYVTPIQAASEIYLDGVLITNNAVPFPVDGLKHTIKIVGSGHRLIGTLGARYTLSGILIGNYHSIKTTDLADSGNPVVRTWKFDQGPDTGTVYTPTEELGELADIMRADDWANTDANKTASGKTVNFNGSQSTWSSVTANNGDTYSGLHVFDVVVTVIQGSVFVSCAGAGEGQEFSSSGVLKFNQVSDINLIVIEDNGDDAARFIGSVEIISVIPVLEGAIMHEITADDWSQTVATNYLITSDGDTFLTSDGNNFMVSN